MHLFSEKTVLVLLCLLFGISLFNTSLAQDKPNLSDSIREMIDIQGAEAAKKHFSSMELSERDQYNVDMERISELTNTYIEAEDYVAAAALSEIAAPFIHDTITKSIEELSPEMAEMMQQRNEQRQTEREQQTVQSEQEKARGQHQSIIERQGQPREDLERFTGIYGDPEAENATRQLWVNVSCDGYLVSGAMWGDASPWWMQSESDNVFTFENAYSNIRIEFTTGADGNPGMIHNLDFMESPLQRVGDLPQDWDSCIERYR